MEISQNDWKRYVERLSSIDKKAGDLMRAFIDENGLDDTQKLIEYAHALTTKYGEAAAELACEMYDAMAAAEGMTLPAAVPAEVASYADVGKAVNGTSKLQMPNAIGRLVKRTAADTTLKNAERDGAQFAWIPSGGETCAFCIALASRGWQYVSKKTYKNGHAEHIHGNCDCNYTIRFNSKSGVKGYDPKVYEDMYYGADGTKPEDKINAMRRMQYKSIKDERNARRRELYSLKKNALSENRTDLFDEVVLKAIGAKSKNYDIMDLETYEMYHLVEGSILRDKEVFAGKGSKKKYEKAYKYAEKYGGAPEDWQHVKGRGVLETEDGDRPAEIHWSQCDGVGKVDLFVKRWLDES